MIKEKKFAVIISVLSNSSLILFKLIVGVISGSISIISEAIHSCTDLLASFIAFFAIMRSSEPADKEHSFGHGKYEDLSGMLEGGLIIVAALYIFYEVFKKFTSAHSEIINTNLAIAVMLFSVIINIFVSKYLFKVADKNDSIAIKADAEHLKVDIYSSLAVMLGLIIIKITSLHFLDTLIAFTVAIIISHTGYKICKKSINNLLDGSLPEEELDTLNSILLKHIGNGVLYIKNIQTRKSGNIRDINLTLNVNSQMTIEVGHNICDEIEEEIKSTFENTSVIIHLEPVDKKLTNQATNNI